MKKRFMMVVATLSMVLMATGCMNSPESILKKASKNMSKLDNYAMNMKMDMGVKSSGVEMNVPVSLDAKVDQKNDITYMSTSVEVMGFKVTTDSYIDSRKEGETITYTKSLEEEDVWEKEVEEEEEANPSNIQELVTKGTKIEKKDSEDKNTLYYQVTISKEEMTKMMEESAAGEDMTEGMEISGDVVIDVYIDKSEKLIKKMHIDFAKFMTVEDEEAELTKFDFEVTFDEYNKVGDVKIPAEVTK